MQQRDERLLVCYVPALDARRVTRELTPQIYNIRRQGPIIGLKTLPSTELVPTLVAGILPHQHGIWQVSLKDEYREPRPTGWTRYLPDVVTTTAQCVGHALDRSYELAAIPHARRRQFELHRLKYTRRQAAPETMRSFNGYDSVFGLLGADSRYLFTKDFGELDALAARLPTGDVGLEFLEMYALDLTQHWNLDDKEKMASALSQTDEFVAALRERCRATGTRLFLLVDHGQEPIVGTVPLRQRLDSLGVPAREYTYFVELASARFWFHTQRAREAITSELDVLDHVSVHDWRQMHEFDVRFEDDAFGELYAFADSGWIFFPHDFYQPVANLLLGATDRHQRARMFNPVHRGNHGYLPHFPSEQGWLVPVEQDDLELVTTSGHIRDVAPTLLSLAGRPVPDYMSGKPLVRNRSPSAEVGGG